MPRPVIAALALSLCSVTGWSIDFEVSRVSDPSVFNRDPVISSAGLAAWTYYSNIETASAYSHIAIFNTQDKSTDTRSLLLFIGATRLSFYDRDLAFVSSYLDTRSHRIQRPQPKTGNPVRNSAGPATTNQVEKIDEAAGAVRYDFDAIQKSSGDLTTVWRYNIDTRAIERMPAEKLNNIAPSIWGNVTAWQWEQEWPFGYEIMIKNAGAITQLTTNRFYDLGPVVHDGKIAWFGWDGFDYEIFYHDTARSETIQITSNRFDDTGPVLWNNAIAWEGYATVEPDIYIWKDGQITKISENLDDDLNPRIWENKVVWQGFDGDDFEIYFYDITAGGAAVKITSNNFDDTTPRLRDDLIAWLGYHDNWDAEIFAIDLNEGSAATGYNPARLTDNEIEDRDVDTAGRRIIWVEEQEERPQIMLAEPR